MWTVLTLFLAISIIRIILMKTDPSHLNGPGVPLLFIIKIKLDSETMTYHTKFSLRAQRFNWQGQVY